MDLKKTLVCSLIALGSVVALTLSSTEKSMLPAV